MRTTQRCVILLVSFTNTSAADTKYRYQWISSIDTSIIIGMDESDKLIKGGIIHNGYHYPWISSTYTSIGISIDGNIWYRTLWISWCISQFDLVYASMSRLSVPFISFMLPGDQLVLTVAMEKCLAVYGLPSQRQICCQTVSDPGMVVVESIVSWGGSKFTPLLLVFTSDGVIKGNSLDEHIIYIAQIEVS